MVAVDLIDRQTDLCEKGVQNLRDEKAQQAVKIYEAAGDHQVGCLSAWLQQEAPRLAAATP